MTMATAKDSPARSASDDGVWSGSGQGGCIRGRGGGGISGFHYSKLVREECRIARIKRRVSRVLACYTQALIPMPALRMFIPGALFDGGGGEGGVVQKKGDEACDAPPGVSIWELVSISQIPSRVRV